MCRNTTDADGTAILAGRGGDDFHRYPYRIPRHKQRAIRVVRRGIPADGLFDIRHDTLSVAAPNPMKVWHGSKMADLR